MLNKGLLAAGVFCSAVLGVATSADAALVVYNTGMSSTFDAPAAKLAEGSVDPHYTLSSTDQPLPPAFPNLFVTKTDGFPIPPWAANGPNSQWIQPVYGTGDNAPPAILPNGHYLITTTFDLTGYIPSTASLSFKLASDNAVSVKLNGNATGITQSGFTSLSSPYTLNNPSWFTSGINTLTFDVTNLAQATGNPTGLRVEFTAADAAAAAVPAVPEPASLLVWSLLAGSSVGLIIARRRVQAYVEKT